MLFVGHDLTDAERREVAMWIQDDDWSAGGYYALYPPMETCSRYHVNAFLQMVTTDHAALLEAIDAL